MYLNFINIWVKSLCCFRIFSRSVTSSLRHQCGTISFFIIISELRLVKAYLTVYFF